LLALVVFTDLAFGWSTTLEVSNASVSTLIYWLTLPWAAWVPSAVPDGALIDATRYFRGDTMSTQGLAERGAWWKFCFAALFFYGLLPRMLTSLFAQLALVRSLENGFELTPGMQAVRARFAQPLVQTQADQPEAMPMARPGSSDPEPDRAHMTGDGAAAATLLSWAGADEASPRVAGVVAGRFAADVASALPVGGGRTLSEDLQTIEQVKHGSDSTPVVLLTKAWEPPLLELFDFVDSLREAVGDARELVVAPVVLEAEPAGDRQIAQWRKKLLELGDGRTRLQPLRVNDDG
ncbi:MAG: DUF2868 domain-containing protein, partial [Gammaproteobacteria bacterium]|nr:DUF2868 domain-containing protein [Gammaproteobacteria bacterium]